VTKDDIHLLFAYDRWANNRVLQSAAALSPEQFTRDLGGAFCSVRDTLVHIIGGEWIWLAYWTEPSHSPSSVTDCERGGMPFSIRMYIRTSPRFRQSGRKSRKSRLSS